MGRATESVKRDKCKLLDGPLAGVTLLLPSAKIVGHLQGGVLYLYERKPRCRLQYVFWKAVTFDERLQSPRRREVTCHFKRLHRRLGCIGLFNMPLYQDGEFFCTIAVSRRGTPVLISQVPSDFDGWLVDGDFPGDDGWQGLPGKPGVYECRMRVEFRFGEPEVKTMFFEATDKIIEQVSVTVC